jgi:hypothetical protein
MGLDVVKQGILPLVNENTARRVEGCHNHSTSSNTRRSYEIANKACQVKKFFPAFSLDFYDGTGHPVGSRCDLNGGLL